MPLQAFTALRYAHFGDRRAAQQRFTALKQEASRRWSAELQNGPVQERAAYFWYLFASVKARKLKDGLDTDPQSEADRKALVARKVEEAAAQVERVVRLLDARATCLDVTSLYEKDDAMKEQVERARGLLKQIAKLLRQ
jgi:hypothetical protein